MPQIYNMSYFMPPIAPIRDENGKLVAPATLVPHCEVSVNQVFEMITTNEDLRRLTEQVRAAPDLRKAKASLLPYVTPCGTFTRRNGQNLRETSGLIVIDIDHLDSYQEAVGMRCTLFNDLLLSPLLTFISPSGRGVKAFVATGCQSLTDDRQNVRECMMRAMTYVKLAYTQSADTPSKGIDTSGKDIARSCFLSYDPGALFRNI